MAPPGWFGKLSCLGDFASRRLPPEWVQACDRWLSECVATSQRQLGDQWLRAYLDAPAWRFAWAPQVVDAQWWFGVLMPSCDKVGRYFPLVIAHSRAAPPVDRYALDHLDLWWSQAAQAAVQTLDEDAEVERFETALDDLPPWPSAHVSLALGALIAPGPGGGQVALPPGATLQDMVHGLASAQLQERLTGHSVWWSWRPNEAAAQCRVVPGLPLPTAFADLLKPQA